MKVNDKIKAIKSLYNAFPVKETIFTEGVLYTIVEITEDEFVVFDDNNHYREIWNVEFNELFVNFTDDFTSLLRQLDVCTKLNKNIPIRVYDYILKQYKSFTLIYRDFEDKTRDKQLESLIINNKAYSTSLTAEELLAQLKEDYDIKED